MSKHTPAPWYIDGTIRGTDLIVSNNDYQIAICITHPNPDSNKANARLIAASPTMYEYIEKQAIAGCEFASKILEGINATR